MTKILINIPEVLTEKLDKIQAKEGYSSRTELILEAIRLRTVDTFVYRMIGEVNSQGGGMISNKVPLENTVRTESDNRIDKSVQNELKREEVWENSATMLPVEALVYPSEYCKYKFEQGKKQKCYKISIEDATGTLKYKEVLVCQNCLEEIKRKIESEGGIIIGS